MNTFKNLINQRFSHASKSYNDDSALQAASAAELIKLLEEIFPDFVPRSILDLGTGTGHGAREAIKRFPVSALTVNDLSHPMLEQALKNLPEGTLALSGDFEALELNSYDLVMSNFAFQWAEDLESLIKKLIPKSKVLAFNCLLEGTFGSWSSLLESHGLPSTGLKYPRQEEVLFLLESQSGTKHHVGYLDLKLDFPDLLSFIYYLKRIGASSSQVSLGYSQMKDFVLGFKEPFSVEYKVMNVVMGRMS
jgi:malonyl-CoA O-methyltransferase